MRFAVSVLILLFVMISCRTKQDIPVSKPVQFDHKDYTENLISGRDSMKNERPIGQNQGVAGKMKTAKKDSISEPAVAETLPEPSADTVKLQIVYGKAKADTMKLARQKMLFEFDSNTATHLNLKLTPTDSTANLRISRIFDPLGNSDGPFGRELSYPVTEKGVYRVVVAESGMNGEPYSGRFVFEVKLGWGKLNSQN